MSTRTSSSAPSHTKGISRAVDNLFWTSDRSFSVKTWELETICMKALEKRIERRYESAKAMGEDLRRFLEDSVTMITEAAMAGGVECRDSN